MKAFYAKHPSESDKANPVNDLLLAQFDETERKRVSALMNDDRLN